MTLLPRLSSLTPMLQLLLTGVVHNPGHLSITRPRDFVSLFSSCHHRCCIVYAKDFPLIIIIIFPFLLLLSP
jgi:hypothetical protein